MGERVGAGKMTSARGGGSVKKVEAIVRKEIFPDIDEALKEVGISGLTFSDVEGRGRAKGREMLSDRGTRTYRPEYVERTRLEVLVKEADAHKVVQTIMTNAKTGAFGDGKIFVSPVEEVYDIASGQSGEMAI